MALQISDDYGRLPLHLAAMFCKCKDILHFIIKQYPSALRMGDTLPLHFACFRNNSVAAESLVAVYPIAATIKNKDGKTPFQCIEDNCTIGVKDKVKLIKKMFRACILVHFPENINNFGTLLVSRL